MKTKLVSHFQKYGILYSIEILSALLFLLIYGPAILNLFYTDWLLCGGDLSQHYLGFALYKNAPWQFQIGMMNTAAYPFSESIIFTDSIPLAAILGKIAATFISGKFQYFGLWGMLCFILQGMFSCLLLQKYTKQWSILLPASLLFVLSPILIRRMFWHTSLASHFLILFALLLLLYREKISEKPWRACMLWGLLGVLCALIHIYFLAMCGILLVCFFCMDFCYSKKPGVFHALAPLFSYAAAALFCIWLLGGFSSGMDDGAPGLGFYSFNLNGFFNPQDWSSVFPNAANYADGQYEGFAYLGLGGIILLTVAVLLIIFSSLFHFTKSLKEAGNAFIPSCRQFIQAHQQFLFYGITFLLILLSAASYEVSFGSRLLFTLPLPEKLISLWGTFRASGRLIWPAVYMLLLFGIIFCIKKLPKRFVSVLLFICLLLQLFDLKDMLLEKHQEFAAARVYETRLPSAFWEDILKENDIEHIVFYDKENLTQEQLYSFAEYAARNELTINDFYFARALTVPVSDIAKDFFAHPDDHTLYIMTYESYEAHRQYPLSYYTFDGLIVGLKTAR